jgi:hypothetical protein
VSRRSETDCARCGAKIVVAEVDPAQRDVSTSEFIRLDLEARDVEGYVIADVEGVGEVARRVWAVVYTPHRHGNPPTVNSTKTPGRYRTGVSATDIEGNRLANQPPDVRPRAGGGRPPRYR